MTRGTLYSLKHFAIIYFSGQFSPNILLNLANSSSPRFSPRIFSFNPMAARAFLTSSLVKSSSPELAIPFCRVFLLWLKDALISLNISLSSRTCTGGSLYLVSLMTADPTLGLGIKQLGGTFAAI